MLRSCLPWVLLCALAAPAASAAVGEPAALAPRPRPAAGAGDGDGRRCTADGVLCIAEASYVADVCGALESAAAGAGLDPHFFARLIWRESLFDAAAVSPKGAQGIAQFIPETAARRGLADPFNPAEALVASADYLADLAEAFGNIGLAAAAYNGGEARVARFMARDGGLPLETRAYVHAITGHSAETWRDAPPASVDLALAPGKPFREACVARATTRAPTEFVEPLPPWGVILASSRDREAAERQVGRLRNRHAGLLGDERVVYARDRMPGMRMRLHYAQIGRDSRAEAEAFCARLRGAGADCMVVRN